MSVFTEFELMQNLHQDGGKIVLLVMDGLGGLPMEAGGKTELETANTPNLDRMAAEGTVGLSTPIRPGIEPGSGPAHLSLFSYDPVHYEIGRGVLEALGIGFPLGPNDIAARGNFASADADGVITDRRAGRISTDECIRLAAKLQEATGDSLPGYEVFVKPVKEHRFVLVIRGEGLGGHLSETDPLMTGKMPLPVLDDSGTDGRRPHGRAGQHLGRRRPCRPGRRTQGQQPQPARSGQGSGAAPLPRDLRHACGGHCRLSHVQGRCPIGRHGDHRF